MAQEFTHLHLHTEYSLLDGAISLDRLIKFGKDHDLKSLAITDHGNIFGAVKFFQKAKKAGIKPILGIEAYLTDDATVKNAQNKYYHVIILVQNSVGYRNLCKLISFSFQQGFYFKPRIDYAILQKHAEGLIILSACLGGHIPKLLMQNEHDLALDRLNWFVDVFGKERFYLEVQPEDQQEQAILNKKLYDLSASTGVSLVATGDCHYVCADDHLAHETMLAIQTHDRLDNPNRYTFGDCRVFMRTKQEMLTIFDAHQEAVWNTGRIAEMCDFNFETGKLFFPQFEVPQTFTTDTYFMHLCRKGLATLKEKKLIMLDRAQDYDARLELEMDLIIKMGFVGYFLVVGDFIQWAKRNAIPVGPGRGSAAGSLVAWALEITNIDPLRYNLLFERFLNPERVTMPDIDIDFCIEGRDKVIEYVRDKYGHDKVCHIITFGTMMAKGVIKDVARALGFTFEDSNMITNLIPEQLKITLKEALELEPRLQEMINTNPRIKQLFDLSFKLEGLTRHASKHAAGIVISPEAIDEVLPVYVPPKSTELVAQYAMSELESIGFLKIDFLGLKNLTLIDTTVKMIAQTRGIHIDIDHIPLDDPKAFALICNGDTSGVFQLESNGLKEVLRKLQPDKFEDIIAVNALYRPGPLGSGMVDDYVERRHGRQKIRYIFDELTPILEETYGVIVYQEQVMKIASTIGGYSLGEADILRRAMGKKKAEEMEQQRAIFLEKSLAKGFEGKKATELFDLMAYFAGYGFNKSHSAAYALIAYHTAYLKANYTAEFMASLLSLEASNAEKLAFYLQETKEMNIEIIPPNINRSEILFSVADNKIVFGLQGIKNVGNTSLENIIAERKKGPFKDLVDLCRRVDLRTTNKRVLENLICAGALDTLPGHRSQQFEEVQTIIEQATAYKKEKATGQIGLFAQEAKTEEESIYRFDPRPEWPDKEKLEKEKEVIGFYLSAHPLSTYDKILKLLVLDTFSTALEKINQTNGDEPLVVCCGLLKSKREIMTKKGDRMAFIQLEDLQSTAEIILFPRVFATAEQWLSSHDVFVIKGFVDLSSSKICKIKANEIMPIDRVLQAWPSITEIVLELPHSFGEEQIQKIAMLLTAGKSNLSFIFHENGKKLRLASRKKVSANAELIAYNESLTIKTLLRL
jgi:DNA polymerase-3 subunit alpha